MKTTFSVIILDDHSLFSEALTLIINKQKDLEVICSVASTKELFEKLQDLNPPDLILVDLKLQGESGLDITTKMAEEYPEVELLALSALYQPSYFPAMIEKGFASFVSKSSTSEELIKAIRSVCTTGMYMNSDDFKEIQKSLLDPAKKQSQFNSKPELSIRESEVLQLICEQKTNVLIAKELYLSPRTIEGHRNRIMEKLGVKNTAGLVVTALMHKLVDWAKIELITKINAH